MSRFTEETKKRTKKNYIRDSVILSPWVISHHKRAAGRLITDIESAEKSDLFQKITSESPAQVYLHKIRDSWKNSAL
jgi:hypothetical protein